MTHQLWEWLTTATLNVSPLAVVAIAVLPGLAWKGFRS